MRKGCTMKVAILAGGLGSRLVEETTVRPKPMVEIGGKPILWHIMKIYSHYGFDEFVVMCGYKGEYIKEYFLNYRANSSDITVNLADDTVEIHKNRAEPWKITLCDTGADTLTGGRIAKIKKYVGNETFMLTYGDGVADIDIPALLECHRKSGKIATLTAVRPTSRFGTLRISADGGISDFREKPEDSDSWINGGFFALEPEVFDYIPDSRDTIWERGPLNRLSEEGQLNAYMHGGFWRPMDMLKDKKELNELWNSGRAPWKIWE